MTLCVITNAHLQICLLSAFYCRIFLRIYCFIIAICTLHLKVESKVDNVTIAKSSPWKGVVRYKMSKSKRKISEPKRFVFLWIRLTILRAWSCGGQSHLEERSGREKAAVVSIYCSPCVVMTPAPFEDEKVRAVYSVRKSTYIRRHVQYISASDTFRSNALDHIQIIHIIHYNL